MSVINRSVSLETVLKAFGMTLTADTKFAYHFWYLYVLVGLYLTIPILKPWVDKHMNGEEPTKECRIVFAVSMRLAIILPTVLRLMNHTGVFWHGAFLQFSGYVFYLLCGCWISKWGLGGVKWPIAGAGILTFGCILWAVFAGNGMIADALSGYTSLFTWTISILLFDFCRTHRSTVAKWGSKAIRAFSNDSFCVFIVHVMVLMAIKKANDIFGIITNAWLFSIIQILGTTIVSVLAAKVLIIIPIIKKYCI